MHLLGCSNTALQKEIRILKETKSILTSFKIIVMQGSTVSRMTDSKGGVQLLYENQI